MPNKNIITHDYIHYDHESRIIRLEAAIENISQTLIRLEKKMDEGFIRLENKSNNLEKRLDDGLRLVNGRLWSNFLWCVTGYGGLLYVMAKGFHWII